MDGSDAPLLSHNPSFGISPEKLSDLFILDRITKKESQREVESQGGVEGLCRLLACHPSQGISASEEAIKKRKEV